MGTDLWALALYVVAVAFLCSIVLDLPIEAGLWTIAYIFNVALLPLLGKGIT